MRAEKTGPEELADRVDMRVVSSLATVAVIRDQQPLPGGPGDLLVHREELDPGEEHGLDRGGVK